jgi:hypothetical protein
MLTRCSHLATMARLSRVPGFSYVGFLGTKYSMTNEACVTGRLTAHNLIVLTPEVEVVDQLQVGYGYKRSCLHLQGRGEGDMGPYLISKSSSFLIGHGNCVLENH